MKIILSIIFLPVIIVSAVKAQQVSIPYPELNHGPYKAGYRVVSLYDNSRSFGRKSELQEKKGNSKNRIIKMHIWYPALDSSIGTPIMYRKYIEESNLVHKSDSLFSTASIEALNSYREYLLSRGSDTLSAVRILALPTKAYWNAENAPGIFPLVLYAPSINSSPFENSVLFEFLVSHGFVVASSPCIGHFDTEVSRDMLGAEAQLQDMEFLLSKCWDLKYVDNGHILIIGYSWGGMTGTLLACKNRNIKGVVSLDGAMGFDEYYNIGRSFSVFNANNITIPYLWFVPASEKRTTLLYDFIKYGDLTMVKVNNIRHADFSSDRLIRKAVLKSENETSISYSSGSYSTLCNTILSFVADITRNDILNYAVNGQMIKRLFGENAEVHEKKKLPAPPSESEFISIIRTRGAKEAVKMFNQIRSTDSTANFFSAEAITAFAYEFGPEKAEDLIDLLQMNIVAHPESIESFVWLVQACMALGETDEARKYLDKIKKIDPDNKKARILLSMIENPDKKQ